MKNRNWVNCCWLHCGYSTQGLKLYIHTQIHAYDNLRLIWEDKWNNVKGIPQHECSSTMLNIWYSVIRAKRINFTNPRLFEIKVAFLFVSTFVKLLISVQLKWLLLIFKICCNFPTLKKGDNSLKSISKASQGDNFSTGL